jgi:peptide/nickel transport system permease protein
MLNYIVRRLIIAFFMLFAIGFVSFVVIKLPPGDFASRFKVFLLQQGTPEEDAERQANQMREQFGLDKPFFEQFFTWVKGIVTEGKFGLSLAYRKDVGELIADRMPKTLLIAVLAHGISTFVGVGLGIYVAPRKYGWADNILAVISFILTSVPRFSIAIVVLYVMVIELRQPSISNFYSSEYVFAPWSIDKVIDMFKHIWPVVLIAGLGGVARNLRVMRGNLLDVLGEQYVQTARSKGLRENVVIVRHAVPNALHTIVAYQGTVLPYMMQGELEVAIVLGIPTMAPLFYESLVNQDIYISGSLLLMYGVLILFGNLLADIFLSILDPRIRYS